MDQPDHFGEPYKESSKQYLNYFKEKFNDSGQALLPIIRQISLPICVTNHEGTFEQVNDAYCALYQYSRDELIGQHFTKVVPDAHKDKLTELHEKFMQDQYELSDEWDVQRKDGSTISIFASAAYVVKDGSPKKVRGCCTTHILLIIILFHIDDCVRHSMTLWIFSILNI